MSAYQLARLEDLRQRLQCRLETLTEKELRELNTLESIERREWEDQPSTWQYGGDMLDVF